MKKKALTITASLFLAVGVLIAVLIASIGFFSGQILATSNEDEDIYYNKLYTISSELINADRDFYQSMLASIQYHDLAFADSGVPAETLAELLPGYLGDYQDNKQQTIDRVNEAAAIAATNADLNKNTLLDGKNFETLYKEFTENFNIWVNCYDVEKNIGDYTLYIQNFDTARASLSDMTDITENWAIAERDTLKAATISKIIVSAVIFGIIAVAVLVISILIINGMRRSVNYIVKSVGGMAGGDFVNTVKAESTFNEFFQVELSMEDMRNKLQTSLLDVVSCADDVNQKANNTKSSISDSEENTNNISVAVGELGFVANHLNALKFTQEQGIVSVEHSAPGREGIKIEARYHAPVLAVYLPFKDLNGISGDKEKRTPVYQLPDSVSVRPQPVDHQFLGVLGHGTHIDHIRLLFRKKRCAVE